MWIIWVVSNALTFKNMHWNVKKTQQFGMVSLTTYARIAWDKALKDADRQLSMMTLLLDLIRFGVVKNSFTT